MAELFILVQPFPNNIFLKVSFLLRKQNVWFVKLFDSFLKRCFLPWNAASAALDFAGGSAIMMLQVCSFQMLLQMIFDINWLDCVLFNIVSWPKIVDDNYSCWKINKSEYFFWFIETPSWYVWNRHDGEEEYGAQSLTGLIARTSVWVDEQKKLIKIKEW